MLRALLEHFVAPAGEVPGRSAAPVAERAAPGVIPPAVGLLCAARYARPVGCAVAMRLVHRGRAGAALVAVWSGDLAPVAIGPVLPAGRRARRVARAIEARGVPAYATGRLVIVDLPGDQRDAADAAARALAVAAAVPTVLVLAGPRDEPLDDLLADRDLVLVADRSDGPLADIAVGALRRRGIVARRCGLPAPPAAAVAARGAAVLPAARREIDAALQGLA